MALQDRTVEEVIRGLELCATGQLGCQMNCPYDGVHGCERNLLREAAKMLKKPEARIMTIQEVKRLHKGDFVWVETPGRLGCYQVELSRIDIRVYECKLYSEYLLCHYMKRWGGFRCWTEKPTDTQRKAVEWIE